MSKDFKDLEEAKAYCMRFDFWTDRLDPTIIYPVAYALKRAYEVGYNDAERTYGNNN